MDGLVAHTAKAGVLYAHGDGKKRDKKIEFSRLFDGDISNMNRVMPKEKEYKEQRGFENEGDAETAANPETPGGCFNDKAQKKSNG